MEWGGGGGGGDEGDGGGGEGGGEGGGVAGGARAWLDEGERKAAATRAAAAVWGLLPEGVFSSQRFLSL